MKAGIPVQDAYAPKRFLEDPLVDGGNGIQALAKRQARLFLHTNIWQRSPAWVGALLEDQQLRHQCAFVLYRRLVRRYGVVCPLPDDGQVVELMWWEVSPIASAHVLETECQALARMLYLAAFTQELGRYSLDYLAKQCGQWNSRLHDTPTGFSQSD
jgi:hypothetical protein